MKIIKTDGKQAADKTVRALKKGGLIAYPTETCYGLGVDVTNFAAVDKLWRFKGQRGNKPVLVAVANLAMAHQFGEINPLAEKIFAQYLPGPVSVVVTDKGKTDPRITGRKDSIGLRMPDYPLILTIIEQLERPITSTSANRSGEDNPYSTEEVIEQDKNNLIDLLLDGGKIAPQKPSTVVDTRGGELKVLRQGPVEID